MTPLDPIEVAQEAGFDISLLELNLSLTHDQRVEQHDAALALVLDLAAAGTRQNENT
jgi:hypothetical protein